MASERPRLTRCQISSWAISSRPRFHGLSAAGGRTDGTAVPRHGSGRIAALSDEEPTARYPEGKDRPGQHRGPRRETNSLADRGPHPECDRPAIPGFRQDRFDASPDETTVAGDKRRHGRARQLSKLEARQGPWFKPSQVAKFTSQQFKDLGEAGLLKTLTERQVPAISETMIEFRGRGQARSQAGAVADREADSGADPRSMGCLHDPPHRSPDPAADRSGDTENSSGK